MTPDALKEALQELRAQHREDTAEIKVAIAGLARTVAELDASGKAHAMLCDADRRRLDRAVEINAAANTKQDLKWAKVMGALAAASVGGGGVVAALLKALGG